MVGRRFVLMGGAATALAAATAFTQAKAARAVAAPPMSTNRLPTM